MVVQIKIIYNYDEYLFEKHVNEFLEKWSYKIISYTLGKNIIMVKRNWLKRVNVYRNEALFITDDEIPDRKDVKPNLDMNKRDEADRSGAIS